jgi:hypothetical protein
MSTAQQGKFNFNQFNEITDRIPAGLQIFLAQQLLSNAAWQLSKFDNPRAEKAVEVMTECKVLRALMKADAEARSKGEANF